MYAIEVMSLKNNNSIIFLSILVNLIYNLRYKYDHNNIIVIPIPDGTIPIKKYES